MFRYRGGGGGGCLRNQTTQEVLTTLPQQAPASTNTQGAMAGLGG